MWFSRNSTSSHREKNRPHRRPRAAFRPRSETLEERLAPAGITGGDLRLTDTPSAYSATAGSTYAYTINDSDVGSVTATGVVLTATVPAGTSFVSGSSTANWTKVGTSSLYTLNVGTVTSGAAASTATFTVNVPASFSTSTSLLSTASIVDDGSHGPDLTPYNNNASVSSPVIRSADLSAALTGPASVTAGSNVTYTLAVTNSGPSDAQNATFTDTIPSNTTFVSATQTYGTTFALVKPTVGGTGTVSGSIATLAASATARFTIVVTPGASIPDGSSIQDTAQVNSGTPDPNLSNNSSTASTTYHARADLAVTQSVPASVTAGTNLTLTVTVTNNGPSNAQGVTLTDTLPAGAFVSSRQTSGPYFSGFYSPVAGTLTGTISTLPASASATFVIVTQVNASAPKNSSLSNTATVATTTTDPTPGNNTSTKSSTVTTQADLAVSMTGPYNVVAGTNLTYTIVLTNKGPSDAQGVALTDAVPTGTTFVSAGTTGGFTTSPPGGGHPTSVVWTATGPVAAGASASFTLVVQAASSAPSGSSISNTATATTTTTAGPSSHTATVLTPVSIRADLGVTLTGSPNPVVGGQNVTYTLTVTNNGPSDAQNVALSDALPYNATFVSAGTTAGFTASPPGPGHTNSVVWTATGPLAAGAQAVFSFIVTSSANTYNGTTLYDSASVTSATPDYGPAPNYASTYTTVTVQADVQVSLSAPTNVSAGNPLTYTLSVTNNGPNDAQNVQFTDSLPYNTGFASLVQTSGPAFTTSTPTAGYSGSIYGSISTLASGATAVFTIVVQVNGNVANGTILNLTASVYSNTFDPNSSNNSQTVSTTVG